MFQQKSLNMSDLIDKYTFAYAYYIIYIPHIDRSLTHHHLVVIKGTTSDCLFFKNDANYNEF